ncbi:MAG: hypothetical protein KKH68_03790, partial [Proteobacteria bacterium]|nr:hypothetical protein [Pseudomonadota bacterium]
MGKNSLLKSTSKKKKSPAKKKDEEVTAEIKTTTTAKKTATKKAKAAPKAKKTTAVPAQKSVAPKKKVSLKDLIQKKFDVWEPEKRFFASPDEKYVKGFVAPPFFKGVSKKEEQRIRELLLKKFDIIAIKAAGQKLAAEKAAAEKTAVEKAAAEKAAAEKAAVEKAAAEKAAAEKAAVEKAAAEPDVSVTCGPPADIDTTLDDPMKKAMKYAAAVFVVLFLLIVGTSFMNRNNYYVKSSDGAIEIWKGKFSPMGEELLIMLPGIQPPESIKDEYSKSDVYPLIFNYYVEKADTLIEVPGMPDFEGIRFYLNQALFYATSSEISKIAHTRLNNLDMMILLYKSDVVASKGTLAGLEDARNYLTEATRLNIGGLQSDLIKQKIVSVD